MKLALALSLALAFGPGEKTSVFAGGGTGEAELKEPFAIDFDKDGNAYIAEMAAGNRVRKVDPSGKLTTIAGTGEKGAGGDGGPAAKAQFNGMHHLLVGPDGNVWIADTWNNCVRRIDLKTGVIERVAGTGEKGHSGDGGPAVKAQMGGIYCIAFSAKGDRLYACDLDNRRIRAVDLKSGVIATVAGNGQKGVPPDGAEAAQAPLVDPRAVAADSKGNLYILERGGHALRVVDPSGRIRTVAGTGKAGLSGDGGPALQAQMNGPKHLSIDRDDSVLIADAETNTIRRYRPQDGKIYRVAGTGKKGSAGLGGPPEQLELARPHGIQPHPSGALYVTDTYNHRIVKIEK